MAHLAEAHVLRDSSKAEDREVLIKIVGFKDASALIESLLVLV